MLVLSLHVLNTGLDVAVPMLNQNNQKKQICNVSWPVQPRSDKNLLDDRSMSHQTVG